MVPRVALPPKVRAVVYYVYGVLGIGLGATQVGFLAAEAGQPTWLTVSLAVFGFVGLGFGLTAATNTPVGDPAPPSLTIHNHSTEGRRVDLDPPGGAL